MTHSCLLFRQTARRLCLALGIALLLAGCSGLGGEPRIVATLPPAPERAEDIGLPTTHPDLAQGAAIFAANCTRCHGASGQGDGQLVLTGELPTPPPDFTDPATAQAQSPTQWFSTITNGRLENLMPPWANSLSEPERWSVALYTYTMSYGAEQITHGQDIWAANCADCHGESGAGDGPRAQELNLTVSDLSLPDALIEDSDAALFETLTNGMGEAMPAFADTLTENERMSVVAFTRTLALNNVDFSEQEAPRPAATAEIEVAAEPTSPAATAEVEIASAADVFGTISGQVSNITTDGQVPDDLVVSLQILDSAGGTETRDAIVDADGNFSFEDVPFGSERGYMVTSSYQDRLFGSDLVQADTFAASLELPFSIYDLTDDRSVIQTNDIVVQLARAGDTLQITQIMSYSNSSDRMYSRSEQVADGRYASVVVPLPVGARLLDFADESQRYVFAENLTALIDTRPVVPGENHIIHVLYAVPFQEGMTVDIPLEYPLQGDVQLMVQPDRLNITSEQLPLLGTQTLGSTQFQSYGGTLSLATGDALLFSVNSVASNPLSGFQMPNNLLPAVLIAVGSLSMLIAAALYYFGRRLPTAQISSQQLSDVIIEQIAELDDLNQQGKIDPKAYQEQRKRLKARLEGLIQKK